MNPLDYSLCCQTVTIYRKTGEKILRKVAENCYLSRQVSTPQAGYGKSMEKKFLLIIPGNACPLQPGDRVLTALALPVLTGRSFCLRRCRNCWK